MTDNRTTRAVELLRKWVRSTRADGLGPLGTTLEELDEIAGMVEAERNELKAKVAELVEKLGNFDGEVYCGGTIVDWYEMAVRLQAQVDEMNETHMKLPVDADDVPIHIGDMLLKSTGAPKASYGEVVGISDDSV